ncbi:MAG TPA: hypothetical protein PLH19_08580 [Anaerolineae bacterium]|nr:hypothetical protein [Anaerolineae bacterium]HQH38571.1 hypothetical protein [Anaerolineae bacterium]
MALRTLYQTLLDSDVARLYVIARQWEITLTAERKPDVAAELADAMQHADAVERVLTSLGDADRAALDALLRRGGALPWAIFTRCWGELRAVGPGRLEREELWRDPVSPLEKLWYLGLVQRAFTMGPAGQVEMAFVPEELRLRMPEPTPLTVSPPLPAAPPTHQALGTDVLADDLATLLAVWQMDSIRSTPPDERQAWMHVPQASTFLETLALEQGWIRRDEQEKMRLVPEPALKWLQADNGAQWGTLVRAWMNSTRWNDLAAVPTLRPDPLRGWPAEPLSTRQAFLELLRYCAPDTWYTFADFTAFVREQNLDFLRTDGDYDAWAWRDAATDKPLRGLEAWDAVEGALIAFLLSGPLAWLGLVDLGGSVPSSPPTWFRLNTAGAALLQSDVPLTLPEPPVLRLSEDGVLVIPLRRRYAHFQAHRIAQPLGWDNGYRYRLTPTSLALARQQRITVERIVAFLEETTARSLPAYLRTAIERAYRGGEPVRLEQVWLLRTPDPTVLEQPALRRFIRESLGGGMALIRAADRAHVLTLLAHSGILPETDI